MSSQTSKRHRSGAFSLALRPKAATLRALTVPILVIALAIVDAMLLLIPKSPLQETHNESEKQPVSRLLPIAVRACLLSPLSHAFVVRPV